MGRRARHVIHYGLVVFRFLLLTVCIPLALSRATIAAQAKGTETIVQFDIPAQPLEDALSTFGIQTGISVLVDGHNVVGRRSAEVKGPFTPAQGLHILLTGTGLEPLTVGEGAITLAPSQGRPNSVALQRYSADLQNAVLAQLCRDAESPLGTYRVAMQLWLDDLGRVKHVVLLSSTGDGARDRRIQERIAAVSLAKPPQHLPQPVSMVILPRSPQESGDCEAGSRPSPAGHAGAPR
jgi:hypothetical protein